MPPVVSIILPTFNRLQFLPATIESVFAQEFSQWELIIVDDGSDAETQAYLRSLEDPRIRLIWLVHSGRPALASNAAIRTAAGQYIAFLDSDDLWLPQKLGIQIQSLRANATAHWSCTRFDVIDAEGRRSASPKDRDRPVASGWILEKLLTGAVTIAQPSVIVSRTLITELGGFDEDLTMCYDDDLWFKLAARSPADGVEQVLTLVRRHAQHSGNDMQAWRDRRLVFEKALQTNRDARLAATLRRLRAEMSSGLAKSHARYGNRVDALRTLITTLPHLCRYPGSWFSALLVTADRFAPQSLRALLRRARNTRTSAGS